MAEHLPAEKKPHTFSHFYLPILSPIPPGETERGAVLCFIAGGGKTEIQSTAKVWS